MKNKVLNKYIYNRSPRTNERGGVDFQKEQGVKQMYKERQNFPIESEANSNFKKINKPQIFLNEKKNIGCP